VRETGRYLVAHPGVDKVSFTGSTAAGREIGEECGRSFKRVQLELGGKSAAIILEDADLETTMNGLAVGSFFDTGQVCASHSRVLAPRGRYEGVLEALSATAASFTVQRKLVHLQHRGALWWGQGFWCRARHRPRGRAVQLRTEDRQPDPVDGPPDRLIPAKPLARRFP
jgi:acyl-CoA reductase-like NAD-dependent aldehyde dehydrogenase